jgi:hypothetical protein
MNRAFGPLVLSLAVYPGLCPGLVWGAPLALEEPKAQS